MAQEKETFLRRWSRRKHEEEKKAPAPQPAATPRPQSKDEAPALPPVDKLDARSDFSVFMHPKVQDSVRRVALKKLFSDPQFNVPDPYEPFSGDWTVAEPISKELMDKLHQARTHLLSDEERKKLEEAEAREAAERAAQEAAAPQEKENQDEPGRKDA